MKKLLLIALSVFALAGIPNVSADSATHSFPYVTAGYGVVAIWCAEGGHDYAPIGTPDQYADPLGWAFSGEPECAPGDIAFSNSEHAWAGGAFNVAGFLGGNLVVTADDDLTENAPIWLGGEYQCGSNSAAIPADLEPHWQSTIDDPRYYVWFYIESAWVVGDDNELCLASSGVATGVMSS